MDKGGRGVPWLHTGHNRCNTVPNWIHTAYMYCTYVSINELYLKFFVKVLERLCQSTEWYQHVLDAVILLIHGLYCLALRQLQQRYFRRHQPAEQPSKHRMIPKRDNILQIIRQ